MTAWDDMRSLLPDNTEGQISAEDMRNIVSALELEDSENLKGASFQNIFVNPDDALDIAEVVLGITDAASDKRYLIQVMPGEHTTKPVGMKPYVYVVGTAKDGAIVTADSPTDTVFTMADQSTVENLIVNGASSGKGFYMGVAGHSHFENSGCTDCLIGVHVDHVDAHVLTSVNWNNTNGKGFHVTAGNITVLAGIILDNSTFTEYVHIDGVNSTATLFELVSFSTNVEKFISITGGAQVVINNVSVVNATTGLSVEGDSTTVIKGGKMVLCDVGISMPNTGGSPSIEAAGVSINNNTLDASILNPNASVTGDTMMSISNSVIADGVNITGIIIDLTEGDEGLQILGELKVGTPRNPSESAFGEGDSYASIASAAFYTWDGAAWANVTEAMASASGSTIALPNVNIDTALYMASSFEKDGDALKIPGFKSNVVTAMTHAGSGTPFVTEYYNGSTWVPVNAMATESGDTYLSRGNNLFGEVGSCQVRLDARLPDATWSKSDPMGHGTALYWIRIRTVSTLTVSPVFEQIKVHSNRTEINEDGYLEFFGKARPFKILPWDIGLMESANASPGNSDMYYGDNLARGAVENSFSNGDRTGFNAFLPLEIDTSTPLRFSWSIFSASSQGNITWTVRVGYTQDGDNVYGSEVSAPSTPSTQKEITGTFAMPISNTQYTNTVEVDISDIIPSDGDILWLTLECTSGQSTNDIVLINVRPEYLSYVLGGHI